MTRAIRVRDLGFMAAAWALSLVCAALNKLDDALGFSDRYERRARKKARRQC